jgi:hypothetical protein
VNVFSNLRDLIHLSWLRSRSSRNSYFLVSLIFIFCSLILDFFFFLLPIGASTLKSFYIFFFHVLLLGLSDKLKEKNGFRVREFFGFVSRNKMGLLLGAFSLWFVTQIVLSKLIGLVLLKTSLPRIKRLKLIRVITAINS